MTNFKIKYQPDYLTPVYNPIQIENYFLEAPATGETNYNIRLDFNISSITANTGTTSFYLNGVEFDISRTPSQNQLPNPSIIDVSTFKDYVYQLLENNPSFDNYYIGVGDYFLTLKNKIAYTSDVITFTASTLSSFTFTENLPQYLYSAQTKDNYSVWVEVYTNTSERFKSVQLTGDTKIFQSSLYKTFQYDNKYHYNINSILQSNSRATNFAADNSDNDIYFQKDSTSLNNALVKYYESYDVQLSTGITTTRKYSMTVEGEPYIYNIWYWDASMRLPFDSKPYYDIQMDEINLVTEIFTGNTTILFRYNPSIGDTITFSNLYTAKTFTVATANNFATGQFALSNILTGTAINFISAFTSVFTGYNLTLTARGYSQVYVKLQEVPFDNGLNLDVTAQTSNIVLYSQDQSTVKNIIAFSGDPDIKFLTLRPRTGTDLYYNDGIIQSKVNSLSIFLSMYGLASVNADFAVYNRFYIDDVWTAWFPSIAQINFPLSDTANGLYHINADPKKYELIGAGEYTKIGFKIVMLISGDDEQYMRDYSEEFEFDIKYACDYETIKSFVWLNSLGGWDYYDFIEDKTTDFDRTQVLISNDYNNYIDETTTYEQVFQNSIEDLFKITTFVESQEEYNWLYELIKSSRVYQIVNNKYIPVVIVDSDYTLQENNKEYKLTIQYRIPIKDVSQKSI